MTGLSLVSGCELDSLFVNGDVNSVDARRLYGFLGSKQEFANWVKSRLEGFEEGVDYCVIDKTIKAEDNNGLPAYKNTKEYILTLDTGKHISMLERNEKGREIRNYFIKCEKALFSPKPAKELTKLEMARQLVESLEREEHQIKALTTSQANNAKLTRENKELKMDLAGKREFMSLSQFLTTLQIKPKKGTQHLVKKLKDLCPGEFEMRMFGGSEHATTCFFVDFLEANQQMITDYLIS